MLINSFAVNIRKNINKEKLTKYVNNLYSRYNNNPNLLDLDCHYVLQCNCLSNIFSDSESILYFSNYMKSQSLIRRVLISINKNERLQSIIVSSHLGDDGFDIEEHIELLVLLKVISRFRLGKYTWSTIEIGGD